MWFCDISDKLVNIKNRSKHNKSKFHKGCEKNNVFVEDYESTRPDTLKIDSIIDNNVRDFYKKFFHTFKTVHDVKTDDGDSVTSIGSDKKLK